MLSFSEYLVERSMDPVELAQRTARIFGKRTKFGKWEQVIKGGHIPLTTFNSRKSESAATKLWKVQNKMGMNSRDKTEREKAKSQYNAAHSIRQFHIKDLHASQPFIRTNDLDKLKDKISNTDPSHIHIVTHKGIHYVADGHHSVMAAKLRGEKTIHAKHINLDQFK